MGGSGRKARSARLLARGLGLSPGTPARPSRERIQRILVIRVDDRVGNVLLTTPLLRGLARHYPEAELDVLVSASKRVLLGGGVRAIPFRKRDFFRRPLRFLRLLWDLRRRGYDLAVDASHWDVFSLTSALLLGLTRARWRVAHDRGEARLFATHLAPPPTAPEHDASTKLRLLHALGIEETDATTETGLRSLPPPPEIDAWLRAAKEGGRPLVGLLPGSRKLDRRAPLELFSAIGLGLRERGVVPVVVYGPGEEDLARALAQSIAASLAPPTDLEALAALLSGLDAVVANDTGPMHLAVAMGVPTLSLFLHPDRARWGYTEAPHEALLVPELGPEETVQRGLRMLQAAVGLGRAD